MIEKDEAASRANDLSYQIVDAMWTVYGQLSNVATWKSIFGKGRMQKQKTDTGKST